MFNFKRVTKRDNNRYDNNAFSDVNNKGVGLSITYKNRYENILEANINEKQNYNKLLQEQIKLNELNRIEALKEKKRQDLIDNLRIEKERKIIELRKYQEEQKRYNNFQNNFQKCTQGLRNALYQSIKNLKKFEDSENAINRRRTPIIDRKKNDNNNNAFNNNNRSYKENLVNNMEIFQKMDSNIFNKQLINEIEKVKFNLSRINIDIKESMAKFEKEAELGKSWKDTLKSQVSELKEELRLSKINHKFLDNYYQSEYIDKIREKKKKEKENIERKISLPYLDLNKMGFLQGQNNYSKSCSDLLLNDNKEKDEYSGNVDLWNIIQKNERRLDALKRFEEKHIDLI